MTPTECAREHVANAQQLVIEAQRSLVEAAGAKEEWVREAVDQAEGCVVAAGVRLAKALLELDAPAAPPYPPPRDALG